MTEKPYRLALSVDVEEWYHSGRWVDSTQAHAVPDYTSLFRRLYGSDRPAGDVIQPTRDLLDLFDRHHVKVTFFVLGEIANYYPALVTEIGARGHEVACHGMHHTDMGVLGPGRFALELEQTAGLLQALAGRRPVGYRAPNLVYEPWATRILEDHGFSYDSTVCASRPVGGKYKDWVDAPSHPYHPSYEAIGRPGNARLVEVPLPSFPVIRINAGSGIMMRVIGFHWTYLALLHESRRGDTSFYFHPWEVGPKPHREGSRLKNALYDRHTGAWMIRAVERILTRFEGRIITVREAAERAG